MKTKCYKVSWLGIVAACTVLIEASIAPIMASGGRVGGGGDWRRIMLGQAKREAANWVNAASLNLELFDQDTTLDHGGPEYKFIMSPLVLSALAQDIISSEHIYREERTSPTREYTTCAWTNDPTTPHLSDIVFSLDLCEGGLYGGQAFANRLLIHESVHHLLRDQSLRDSIGANFAGSEQQRDLREDQLCDTIALAVHKVFDLVVLSGRPHWRDIENPYFSDPSSNNTETFSDRGFHSTVWTGATLDPRSKNRMIVWGGCRQGNTTIYACGDDQYFNDGAIYSPDANTWKRMSTVGAPSARAGAATVWTGATATDSSLLSKMIVWGGCAQGDGCETKFNDGGIYDPAADQWQLIKATPDAPKSRVHHSAVWTGSQLIVWGGHPADVAGGTTAAKPLNDGGLYNPATKSWIPIPSNATGTPSARGFHTAIWTGNTQNGASQDQMLVFGGCEQEIADACAQPFGDGAFFNPANLTWTKLRAGGAPLQARHNFSAVYDEQFARLYIFGGIDGDGNVLGDGAILDLRAMEWRKMARIADGIFKHRAVWAGDRMLVFGGKNKTSSGIYDFASSVIGYIPGAPGTTSTGRWITYKTDELAPLKTIEHSAIWTGYSLIAWGGQIFDRGFTNTGSQFFPGLNAQ